MIASSTMSDLVEEYVLIRETRPATVQYYHTTVRLFAAFLGSDKVDGLTAGNVSRFLQALQNEGRSSYYRKSLRNGLVALLRFAGDAGRVRSVRLDRLQHAIWNPAQVRQLIAACAIVFSNASQVRYWETLIAAAWYSGLSAVDLHQIERRHVGDDGRVSWIRTKTRAPVVTYIPADLVSHVDRGPVWPLESSKEWFRRQFQRIVKQAGLAGSFKMLRRSSGSNVECLNPGRGHEHLGNTRAVFERHYRFGEVAPLRPESLQLNLES